MKRQRTDKILLVVTIFIMALHSSCGHEQELSYVLTYEQFRSEIYREPHSGIYIINGDTPIEDEKQLYRYYENHYSAGARRSGLIVNRVSSIDDRWNERDKLSLTYCVSTAFGARHRDVVQAMNRACQEWEYAAAVRFVYLPTHDSACNSSNRSVVFDVSPTSRQPYLARAFFPSSGRSYRNILIDDSAFYVLSPLTLTGIMRHEVGHILGFRHEHTRPEAARCFEDSSWRPLTPYDSSSVMHYPQCNGTGRGDLVLTSYDREGVSLLYGTPLQEGQRIYADFNGDGKSDVAALYDYGDSNTGLVVLYSTGSGFSAPSVVYSSGVGNWTWAKSKVVAGDFNGDGKSDVAALYDYGDSNTGLVVLYSTGSGFSAPSVVYSSGVGNWTWAKSKVVAGDFNGDGKSDVAALYDYGDSNTGLVVLYSTGSGFSAPSVVYSSGVGNWTWAKSKVVAGDFNGDGKSDVAALYDYGDSNTGLVVLYSTGSGFSAPSVVYSSGVGNWTWAKSKVVAGDFNGDGKSDVAALYDYGDSNTGLVVLYSTGSGFSAPSVVYSSGVGNWTWAKSKVVAGDFNGDGKSDVAALYDYGDSNTGLVVLYSTGSGFSAPSVVYSSGVGNWTWAKSILF